MTEDQRDAAAEHLRRSGAAISAPIASLSADELAAGD